MESKIQSKIIQRLRSDGWMVIKIIKSNTHGIPDLLIHRHGQTAYIEVKRPSNEPTELQQYRMKELASHGINSITCTSVEECYKKLQSIISKQE